MQATTSMMGARAASIDVRVGVAAAAAGVLFGLLAAEIAGTLSPGAILVAAVALSPVCALALGSIRRVLLAAMVLDIPLMWDVNLLQRGVPAYPPGLNVSLTTLALGGLYAIWLSRALVDRDHGSRLRWGTASAAIAYLLLVAVSVFVSRDKLLALFAVILLAQYVLVFLYVSSTLAGPGDVTYVFVVLLCGVVFESLAIIASYATGHDVGFAGIQGRGYVDDTGAVYRPGGTIGSPNVAGSFLLATLPLAALLLLTRVTTIRVRRLAAVAFGLGLVALVLTASRGGWIGFVVAMIAVAVVGAHRRLIKPRHVLLVVAATAIVCALLWGVIAGRLSGGDSGAAEARIPLMEIAWNMIRDHPFVGVGASNFLLVAPDYKGPQYSGAFISQVHNQYLLVWSEAGTFAAAAFVAFLIQAIRRAWYATGDDDRLASVLATGLLAAFVGLLPNMFVERFVNRPQVGLMFLFAGLVAVLALHRRRRVEALAGPLGRVTRYPQQRPPGARSSARRPSVGSLGAG